MFYSVIIQLAAVLIVLWTNVAHAAETSANYSATIHLDISYQPPPVRADQSAGLLRRTLKYLGIRSQTTRHIEPGTGLTVSSTAYAPSPYQTDATPCITAAGTKVRPGVVAANFLPLGTLLQIGNDVYIVEDRMNPRYPNSIDIFFPSTSEALAFGRQKLDIIIIGYGKPGQPLPREQSVAPATESASAAKPDPNTPATTSSAPDFTDRIIGRVNYWQRVASDFVGLRSYDVNRYDINCFTQS